MIDITKYIVKDEEEQKYYVDLESLTDKFVVEAEKLALQDYPEVTEKEYATEIVRLTRATADEVIAHMYKLTGIEDTMFKTIFMFAVGKKLCISSKEGNE